MHSTPDRPCDLAYVTKINKIYSKADKHKVDMWIVTNRYRKRFVQVGSNNRERGTNLG